VFLRIRGKRHYLWRAVDQDSTVLDILVQSRRNAKAAKRFFKKLLKGLQYVPRVAVTDKLASYGAAKKQILPGVEHRQSRYLNNRAEVSHQPTRRRERQMQRFKSARDAQPQQTGASWPSLPRPAIWCRATPTATGTSSSIPAEPPQTAHRACPGAARHRRVQRATGIALPPRVQATGPPPAAPATTPKKRRGCPRRSATRVNFLDLCAGSAVWQNTVFNLGKEIKGCTRKGAG
jgi:hypothetical protein